MDLDLGGHRRLGYFLQLTEIVLIVDDQTWLVSADKDELAGGGHASDLLVEGCQQSGAGAQMVVDEDLVGVVHILNDSDPVLRNLYHVHALPLVLGVVGLSWVSLMVHEDSALGALLTRGVNDVDCVALVLAHCVNHLLRCLPGVLAPLLEDFKQAL